MCMVRFSPMSHRRSARRTACWMSSSATPWFRAGCAILPWTGALVCPGRASHSLRSRSAPGTPTPPGAPRNRNEVVWLWRAIGQVAPYGALFTLRRRDVDLEREIGPGPGDPGFTGERGGPFRPPVLQRPWSLAGALAEHRDAHLRDLRHATNT